MQFNQILNNYYTFPLTRYGVYYSICCDFLVALVISPIPQLLIGFHPRIKSKLMETTSILPHVLYSVKIINLSICSVNLLYCC